MRKELCNGEPSITRYGQGCRCVGCRLMKADYERERRRKKRMDGLADGSVVKKKPGGKRDNPFVMNDAFTREQILEARR
jgi:hypothetical protein